MLTLQTYLNTSIYFYHMKLLLFSFYILPCLSFWCKSNQQISKTRVSMLRKYPISHYFHEEYLKRLNSRNVTIQQQAILGRRYRINSKQEDNDDFDMDAFIQKQANSTQEVTPGIRIILNPMMQQQMQGNQNDDDDDNFFTFRRKTQTKKNSENFQIIQKSDTNFNNVGGYHNIKQELNQCIDMLTNFKKYQPYNVRVPKGLIFEGPPGNGKTLISKALAGEANTTYIAVSGSEFQEKYVGVGASRIRELFNLAKDNVPCVIFIDEIDALGKKRSSDGDTATSERDSTLNELLVALDGFKNTSGVFLVGATNRIDLLDPALLRPGRIDKRIYIGNPDKETRKEIINIHIQGKPHDSSFIQDDFVELTNGLSGAQIENLLNEAMLQALRYDRHEFNYNDLDVVYNKMLVGWQPSEHEFTTNMIDHIAIHELGHAVVGILSKHHSKMSKVIINLSAPNTPAYTVFEPSKTNLMMREALFEHLMILLAGRIAEEVFYDVSVTTGAINDFEEALNLAQKMICYYGMGKEVIYPSTSEKYKEMIDSEVASLIKDAYSYADFIIRNSKELIIEGSEILKRDKVLKSEKLVELINSKYQSVLTLKV